MMDDEVCKQFTETVRPCVLNCFQELFNLLRAVFRGMSFGAVILGLEQLSCLLSIFGSVCVALTWAYPVENRFKHGRILLLWLSFADGISSLVYFLQTVGISDTEDFCTIMALLGIFFPVASFLWTDFIAFYLYLTVVRRTRNPISWTTLLRVFHVIAWSVSLVIIIVVAVFDHAGRSNEGGDDDLIYSNTGTVLKQHSVWRCVQ